jgi:hypothetical protein
MPPPAVAGVGYIPPDTWQALIDNHEAVVAQAGETARNSFTAAVDEAGAQAEWTELHGVRGGLFARPTRPPSIACA